MIAQLLNNYFKNEPVLYIWDNCTDVGHLSGVISPENDNIITTKLKEWGDTFEVILLEVWSEETAYQFMEQNINTEKDLFRPLINELGNHTLAIQHALSYIQQTGITLKEYLSIITDSKADVLSQDVILHQGIKSSVFVSFLIQDII